MEFLSLSRYDWAVLLNSVLLQKHDMANIIALSQNYQKSIEWLAVYLNHNIEQLNTF